MKYIIEIEYGSEYQKKVWGELFDSFLKSFKTMMEYKHKKNKIVITKDE